MTPLLQKIDGRLAHYRKLNRRPDYKPRMRGELRACIQELEWVRDEIDAAATALPDAPKTQQQISLI